MTTTSRPAAPSDADRALKSAHRGMWALGDYPSVASEVIAALGTVVVEASGLGPGDRVLDVAAGSGNAAVPAARTGASVVASDLTPALLEVGRAAAPDLPISWERPTPRRCPTRTRPSTRSSRSSE